jgi:hypothetical protein
VAVARPDSACHAGADEYPVHSRPGPAAKISDAELVALAVCQAAMGLSSDRQFSVWSATGCRGGFLSPVALVKDLQIGMFCCLCSCKTTAGLLRSRAHPAGRARLVLGRSVCREDRACCRHLAVDESQGPEQTVVAENALAAAQRDRVEH